MKGLLPITAPGKGDANLVKKAATPVYRKTPTKARRPSSVSIRPSVMSELFNTTRPPRPSSVAMTPSMMSDLLSSVDEESVDTSTTEELAEQEREGKEGKAENIDPQVQVPETAQAAQKGECRLILSVPQTSFLTIFFIFPLLAAPPTNKIVKKGMPMIPLKRKASVRIMTVESVSGEGAVASAGGGAVAEDLDTSIGDRPKSARGECDSFGIVHLISSASQ